MKNLEETTLRDLRRRMIEIAFERGCEVISRPKGIKFNEKGALLLPDMLQDSNSGLSVGQRIMPRSDSTCPWGLEPVSDRKLPWGGLFNVSYVVGFAQLSANKACTITGTFFAVAGVRMSPIIVVHYLDLVVNPETKKLTLIPVECAVASNDLEPEKS